MNVHDGHIHDESDTGGDKGTDNEDDEEDDRNPDEDEDELGNAEDRAAEAMSDSGLR